MSDDKRASYRIPEGGPWGNAWKITAALGAIGLGLSAFAWSNDPRHFAFSWLFAFIAFLTIGLGTIFFVIIQHLTVSHWSVTVRRTAEFFGAGVPIFALLFLPIAIEKDHLYEWAEHLHGGHHASAEDGEALIGASVAQAQEHGEEHAAEEHGDHHTPQHALHAELLDHKTHGWLRPGRWHVGAGIYFLIWTLLGWFYFRTSTEQDETRDKGLTVRMQRWAPLATIAFALSLTFAMLDWVMSLEPTWYSTIYGVYVFAGCAVTAHAIITVVTLSLRSNGLLGDAVNTEHFHDLGKMTFGFIVFWAYVGFSQMMLIWYANIPEETVYYAYRWHGGDWRQVSWLLVFGHFAFPFLFLMSRNVKRKLAMLGFGCMWMLVIHLVDIYWFVMPRYSPGKLSASWLDIATLLAVGGVYLTVVFLLMKRHPLIPIGDPRLARALHHSQ